MSKLPYIIGLLTILVFGIHSSIAPNVPPSHNAANTGTTFSEPVELNIQMAFYPQAPLGNWSLPFAEACEEASALLVANAYYHHNWTAKQFSQEILNMVDWEKNHFGKYIDTSASETAEILNKYLDLPTVIHENPSIADIKKMLGDGHLIIGFFAGRELHNPNYQNGGPRYHALVIKGYRQNDQIITDDVGTAQGGDYTYSWDTIHTALHDLNDPIDDGPKRVLEVWPPD